jgi:hypothetical protein
MLKELRDNGAFKFDGVLHDKRFTIVGPSCNAGVARIDHMKRFCIRLKGRTRRDKMKKRRLVKFARHCKIEKKDAKNVSNEMSDPRHVGNSRRCTEKGCDRRVEKLTP